MDMNMTKEIIERLDLLALKIGATGSQLWEVLIKQAYFEGCISTLTILISATYLCFAKGVISRRQEKLESIPFSSPKHVLCVANVCIAVVLALTALILMIENFDGIYALFNPEFFALKTILGN